MLLNGLGGEELAGADMAANGAAGGENVVLRMSRGCHRVHGDGMLAECPLAGEHGAAFSAGYLRMADRFASTSWARGHLVNVCVVEVHSLLGIE